MKENFIINIYTENYIGLLSRVAGIFTRRHINIETMSVSKSEMENIHRFTILIHEELEMVKKVTKQFEKQVDVLKAFSHHEDDTIYQKIALFKFKSELKDNEKFNAIVRDNKAEILLIEAEFLIVKKVDKDPEIIELFEKLKEFEILEFNKSGRIAITKKMKTLKKHVEELEQSKSMSL